MIRRTTIATAATLALLTLATACGGDDQPEAVPPPASDSTTPTTTPAPTTSTAPAWQAKYTPDELKAYEAALQRWESYEQRSESIWAAGKATPQAEQLFKEYNGSTTQFELLKSYEAGDVQVIGLGSVLDSRAREIRLDGNSGSVSIRQCVDYAGQKIVQAGKTLQPITDKPQLRQIDLYLAGDPNQWFIGNIVVGEGKSPC